MFTIFLIFACWFLAIIAVLMIIRHVAIIRAGNDRIEAAAQSYSKGELLDYSDKEFEGIRGWLYRGGFKSAQAPILFFLFMLVSLSVASFLAFGFISLGFRTFLVNNVDALPAGVGDIAKIPLLMLPYLLFFGIGLLPLFVVLRRRKAFASQVEQGMPIILELLATLSESGLTLDGAIEHILLSYRRDHPLAGELTIYRADLKNGRTRVECLRRMAKRVDVIAFTAFISAIVLAEQRGASISAALRIQAEELRRRRREKALEIALTAPLKRVIPLVLFFLPGIFIYTLGPIYYQIFSSMEILFQQGGSF